MTALRFHRVDLALAACATLFAASIQPAHGAAPDPAMPASQAAATVSYHKVDVDGVKVFYREAGPKNAPAILLLHGFPTSSHMFRELIPKLSDRYRVIAPDYPGYPRPSCTCSAARSGAEPAPRGSWHNGGHRPHVPRRRA